MDNIVFLETHLDYHVVQFLAKILFRLWSNSFQKHWCLKEFSLYHYFSRECTLLDIKITKFYSTSVPPPHTTRNIRRVSPPEKQNSRRVLPCCKLRLQVEEQHVDVDKINKYDRFNNKNNLNKNQDPETQSARETHRKAQWLICIISNAERQKYGGNQQHHQSYVTESVVQQLSQGNYPLV